MMVSISVAIIGMLLMFIFGVVGGWRARGVHEGFGQ